MNDCCDQPLVTEQTATTEHEKYISDHDECGYPATHKGVIGTNYPYLALVKFDAATGRWVPQPDGVGAHGIVMTGKEPVVAGDENIRVKTFVARANYDQLAAANNVLPANKNAFIKAIYDAKIVAWVEG